MNYYIDFDHTLFDTSILTKRMLQAIVDSSKMDIMEECKLMFNREHIYNIYELVKYFSNKYNLDENAMLSTVKNEINNCSDLVFSDVIEFLKELKAKEHKIYMLSYYEHDLQYQLDKIAGSKLADLFDGIIITKELKYNLDIDYTNGIFIDDKPEDLTGLYSKNPLRLIRLKRKDQKYSIKNIEENIEEYENFSEIPIE